MDEAVSVSSSREQLGAAWQEAGHGVGISGDSEDM